MRSAFIKSFNGGLRDEFLNETLFTSPAQGRAALEEWRRDYNTVRPHSRIAWLTLTAYAAQFSPQRGGMFEPSEGSVFRPVVISGNWTKSAAGLKSPLDKIFGQRHGKAGISEAIYYHWRMVCGGLMAPEMKRLKELDEED